MLMRCVLCFCAHSSTLLHGLTILELVIHTVDSRNSLPVQILCHGSQYGGKIHLAENSSGPLMRHGERISPVHQHSSKVQVEAMEAHGRRARCGERYFENWWPMRCRNRRQWIVRMLTIYSLCVHDYCHLGSFSDASE